MLEIKPVTTPYPLTKPVKINKDDPHSRQKQAQKKPVPLGQTPESPMQHIDEIA